jgi:hypothetical protein
MTRSTIPCFVTAVLAIPTVLGVVLPLGRMAWWGLKYLFNIGG